MKFPEYKFIDVAVGGPTNRNNVIEIESFVQTGEECYATWHRFPEGYKDHWDEKGTVAGYAGPSYADFLPVDFDGSDLEEVRDHVVGFLDYLSGSLDIGHGVRVYFSGKKGFHVYLDAELFGGFIPSIKLAGQLKDVAEKLTKDFGGFDKTIYDRNRLLRTINSKHKSGLYKVAISMQELRLPIEQIAAIASKPRKVQYPEWGDCVSCNELQDLMLSTKTTGNITKSIAAVHGWPTGMKSGDGRNNFVFNKSRALRDYGLPPNVTIETLELWDKLQVDRLGSVEIRRTVESAYRHNVQSESSIKTLDDAIIEYEAEIEMVKAGKLIHTGFDLVDSVLQGIYPGEVCTVIARSGVGKTMLGLNICKMICLTNPKNLILFASLEMPNARLVERWLMMTNKMRGSEVRSAFNEGNQLGLISNMQEVLQDRIMLFPDALGVEDISATLEAAFRKKGENVDMLMIDYLGLMKMSGGAKVYEKVSQVARDIKKSAKENNIAIVLFCQVGREQGEDGGRPLHKHSARDSGAVEESADILLGMFRPNLNAANNDDIHIQILKHRRGREGQEFAYPVTWQYTDIHPVGREIIRGS